jgi:hypothetical protein
MYAHNNNFSSERKEDANVSGVEELRQKAHRERKTAILARLDKLSLAALEVCGIFFYQASVGRLNDCTDRPPGGQSTPGAARVCIFVLTFFLSYNCILKMAEDICRRLLEIEQHRLGILEVLLPQVAELGNRDAVDNTVVRAPAHL